MKKILFVIIAIVILAGCMSTPNIPPSETTPRTQTKLVVGLVQLYFYTDKVMEITIQTLDGKEEVVLSPENPIVEGPNGIEGLNAYLMIGTYGEQPIALVVEEISDQLILRQIMIDLGDDGILIWKISGKLPDNAV